MDGLHSTQTWRRRVAELLDDPVARAVLRRDGLSKEDVIAALAPVAAHFSRRSRQRGHAQPHLHPQAEPQPHHSAWMKPPPGTFMEMSRDRAT